MTVTPDPEFTECYSDHAHDIATRGMCDMCGSDDPEVVGHVLPEAERLRGVDPVAAAKRVMASGYKFVDGVLLDAFSASAIVAVAEALSPENEARLRAMTVTQAATVCFRIIEKQKGAA